jgi:hypothetical protein
MKDYFLSFIYNLFSDDPNRSDYLTRIFGRLMTEELDVICNYSGLFQENFRRFTGGCEENDEESEL